MADYQQLIDEIRFYVGSDVYEMTDAVREMAEVYNDACRQVNARLRRCGEFLKRELRGEAIHLAEAEPKLLDLIALLDFPEREDWINVLAMYDMPKPDPLMLEIASELNEAYSAEEPLQDLLGRHRLLALVQAPLRQRIAVMRKIHSLDPTASIWEEDIRTFEKARCTEIEEEAKVAEKNQDGESLKLLLQEALSPEWLEAPSKALVGQLKTQASQLARSAARQTLEELSGRLNGAFAALDLAAARALREEWDVASTKAKLSNSDPLLDGIQPVLDWIADEDCREDLERSYERAVSTLERAIENSSTKERLERLAHDVRKCGRDIPEPLATRYRTQVEDIELAETRHRRLLIGSAVTILVLVVAVMVVSLQAKQRANEAARIISTIAGMVDNGQLDEADKLFSEHQKSLTSDRGLQLKTRLVEERDKEGRRLADFRTSISNAESTSEIAEARRLIEHARSIAKGSDEELQLARLERQWNEKERKERGDRENAFQSLLDLTASNLKQLEALVSKAPDSDAIPRLSRDIDGQLAQLKADSAGVAQALTGQVALFESRLKGIRDQMARRGARDRQLVILTNRSLVSLSAADMKGDVEAFAEALKSFADAFPEDSRSTAFRNVAAESAHWEAALVGGRTSSAWSSLLPADVAGRLAECESYRNRHPNSPFQAAFQDYAEYLTAGTKVATGENSLRSRMRRLLQSQLIGEVWMLKSAAGEVFYLTSQEDFSQKSTASFKYLVGFNGETIGKTLKTTDLAFSKAQPAPQVEVTRKFADRIASVTAVEWPDFCKSLASDLLKAPELDPFLKCYLLKQVLQMGAEGNAVLEVRLKPHLDHLNNTDLDPATNWVDPRNEMASAARTKSNELLRRMPPLDGIWEAIPPHEQKLKETFQSVEMVGWLHRTNEGWRCESAWSPAAKHVLKVLIPDSQGLSANWMVVGSADAKGIRLEGVSGAQLEGRPVFAFPVES